MLFSILIFGFMGFTVQAEGLNQRTWTYELKAFESNSSNKDIIYFDIQKERISRGCYSISGEVLIDIDVEDNDGNTVGVNVYRSALGDGNYKALPFQVPPKGWISFMNTIYKDTVMESFKDCSDLLYTKDKFASPMVKKRYTLTKCQVSEDGFPSHLEEGFYKLELYGKGVIDWQLVIIVQVEKTI